MARIPDHLLIARGLRDGRSNPPENFFEGQSLDLGRLDQFNGEQVRATRRVADDISRGHRIDHRQTLYRRLIGKTADAARRDLLPGIFSRGIDNDNTAGRTRDDQRIEDKVDVDPLHPDVGFGGDL